MEKQGAEVQPHDNHICLYVTRYQEIWENMRHFGVQAEMENSAQFRFAELPNGTGGAAIFHCEHEIRNLYHKDYARPLVNRGIANER